MKMRFWQKTYLFTLILFLLCLNIGILSLAIYTYNKNVSAVEDSASAEQYYIAMSFERDYRDLFAGGAGASPSLLMESYGTHYKSKGLFLEFKEGEDTVYSSFDVGYEAKKDHIVHAKLDGKRHVIISDAICDERYTLVYAKNVESLDTEFRRLAITYVATALVVSCFLAVCLYFILKRLSAPLDKLRNATETVQAGDFSVTAEESGNDEFTLLAKSFNSMLKKINEQMEALETNAEKKQMLVDNMAHELRTPLTSIHGYAEYLEKAATTEENKIMAARYIISEAERLQKISDILLDSAYLNNNAPEMHDIDLGHLLEDTKNRLLYKAQNKKVTLEAQTAPLRVHGNETLLSMLFYNLGENAVKACDEGGTVVLGCGEGKAFVADNGKGMSSEQLTHITEPFYRTDKSRSRAEGGAGLGLALCKQIADAHGCILGFESREGKGTKATVTFTT